MVHSGFFTNPKTLWTVTEFYYLLALALMFTNSCRVIIKTALIIDLNLCSKFILFDCWVRPDLNDLGIFVPRSPTKLLTRGNVATTSISSLAAIHSMSSKTAA